MLATTEALSALAGLAHDHPGWCYPEWTPGSGRVRAQALGHPLLGPGECVRNDVELGPEGITCNAIAPGFIVTEMTQPLLDDQDFDAWVRGRVPLGRWGQPAEIGNAAVFLASPAGAYINGHVLTVDGGMVVNA